ncbi:MAG: hypothetical protein JNK02_03265 [Planctomycetes bacterium]|nr:hypothetical protein [Planctomycetota bacterium]
MRNALLLSILPLVLTAAASGAGTDVRPAPRLPPFLPDVKPAPAPLEPGTAAPAAHLSAVVPARDGHTGRGQGPSQEALIDAWLSRVWIDEPGDGRTWARGRTYKASFGAEGATYIPFLGSEAPRNFPVSVSLLEASSGGAPIPLGFRAVSSSGTRVAIDHGAIREVWHLEPDSAEQTFEFATRPAVEGVLTLRLAITSELALRPDGSGFALDGEHGGVRIGGATAIDADGRRLELAARTDGAALTIDVPAAFVASARFPLVVDPLYTTHTLDGFGYRTANVDVAGGGFPGLFAASYGVVYSQSDTDIYTQDLFYGAPVPGAGDWVDFTTLSWYDPQIAYNGDRDTYLTTATVQPSSGNTEIWCRARRTQTANEFPQRLVQNNAGGAVAFSDVGGDPTLASPSYFLAVWTRFYSTADQDIHAQLLDPFGVRVGGVIYLENSGAHDSFPRISKSVGVSSPLYQQWNIAWQRDSSADVLGARVAWDGFVTHPAFGIATSFLFDDFLPAPSTNLDGPGASGIWMVAFQRGTTASDIFVQVMHGSTTIGQANLSNLNGDVAGWAQGVPRIDSNGRRFVVTYNEAVPGNPYQSNAYLSTLAWAEGAIRVDEARVPIETGPWSTYWVDVAGGRTPSTPGFGFYALGWTPFLQPNSAAMCGAYYEPGTYETFCAGDGTHGACPCGNTGAPGAGCANSVTSGGVLVPSGVSFVEYDSFALDASNLPSSTTCLFYQGTGASAPGTAFGDGLRCASGVVIRIGSKTASGGNATYPGPGDPAVSVRGSIPAGGAQRTYQVWYRNAAPFCTAATFNTTNGVRVRWLL